MYVLHFSGFADVADLRARPGAVVFNGATLKPHEAAILADRLHEVAAAADDKARAQREACRDAVYAAKYAAKAQGAAEAAA